MSVILNLLYLYFDAFLLHKKVTFIFICFSFYWIYQVNNSF